ncbi:MAG: acyl carrier protein [Solirubrobacterales bacterium]|nr:acyl carrier protein [Solirubrobacterales bacterium]MBV9165277.1 acyl carrier protein [Solirubrobacterales bacterium]MBV9534614.1 acyl carrier protein [Solirubrobacterales bacterium]
MAADDERTAELDRPKVVALIRGHLAEELEIDSSSIDETTRFREDLDADSLDLYTLVQELEDTYGIRMSDEEAAKIRTVGQAVDFVLATVGPGARPSSTATPGPEE